MAFIKFDPVRNSIAIVPLIRRSEIRHMTHQRRVRNQEADSLPSIFARPILQPIVRFDIREDS